MNTKLIEELEDMDKEYSKGLNGSVNDHGIAMVLNRVKEILSRHTKAEVEPLAVINALCKRAYETAKSKGWHDKPVEDGTKIALMHSELSEALEAMRKPDVKDEHLPHLNPVGLEMADVVIRVLDFCGAKGIDLGTCIKEKMNYNEGRPIKHGGKLF